MNDEFAGRFRDRRELVKTVCLRPAYLLQTEFTEGIGMTSVAARTTASLSVAVLLTAGAPISEALASQGPGTGPGGASATTQLGMAIVVYGTSIVIIAAGLIKSLRQR
jgi:hypothetical protein